MLCSICKKNVAVIYMIKHEGSKKESVGYCLTCARKNNINFIDNVIKQFGLSEEEFDAVNEQVNDLFQNSSPEELQEAIKPYLNEDSKDNLLEMFTKAFSNPSTDEDDPEKQSNLALANFDDEDKKKEKSKDKFFGKDKPKDKTKEPRQVKKHKYLDAYGSNLTFRAMSGELDNIIGREKEIERVTQILNRRTKNNPVIIGEPGVGKTAIAEGLAIRIAEGKVPDKLLDFEVILLDMTGMVAGTQFRGQFESRIKGVIDEAKAEGNIILVIDELHNIMGAGSADGAMNAANILKPSLAKGEVRIIGTTTLDEYRKHIEKDSALERRFQPVIVDEPSREETCEILKGLRKYYESYHKVVISDEVIKTAVDLSEMYIYDRFLPDKAIDIIDEASSKANLNNTEIIKFERLKNKLDEIKKEIEVIEASPAEIKDYQRHADLKTEEFRLVEEYEAMDMDRTISVLTLEDIAGVVEMWSGIPVKKITETDSEKLLNLESRIGERIIGQKEAVEAVSRAIRRSRAGLRHKKRPASFIFVGPTGVGKTELVKALAREIFGTEDSLIRLDMSEYMEKHTVSKLIGSPPGYVGYDEGGQLTEKIRRRPYSVILMDEIEKAHSEVFNILLQVLDDGRLTDSKGKVVNFENTIIIMTSNIGTTNKMSNIGFGSDNYQQISEKVKDNLKEYFRPEFLNRVDEVVVFKELTKEELYAILDLLLKEYNEELLNTDIRLIITNNMKDHLISYEANSKYGARPLKRSIQKNIEDKLSYMYLKSMIKDGDVVEFDYIDNEVKVNIQ